VDEAQSSASHAGSLWGFGTMRALQRAETFALIRGEVDAIFAPGSVGVETAALLGGHVVVDLDASPDPYQRLNNATLLALTVDGALLGQQPGWVARVVARVSSRRRGLARRRMRRGASSPRKSAAAKTL